MLTKQFFINKAIAVRLSLLALIFHALATFVFHAITAFEPHQVLRAGRLEYLSWHDRFPWRLGLFCTIGLFLEILVLRKISKPRPWVVSYFLVMALTACTYLLYLADLSFHVFRGFGAGFEALDLLLLLAVLFAILEICGSRHLLRVESSQLIQITIALVLAIAVVFAYGNYFPEGAAPQWVIDDVPAYVDIITLSGFQYPMESSMVLCVFCFALVSVAYRRLSRIGE